MRYFAFVSFWMISLVICSLAQSDVGISRGNIARTGEIDAVGTFAFGSVAWKSPQIFDAKIIQENVDEVLVVKFAGQRYSYDLGLMSTRWFRLADLPVKGRDISSGPIIYRGKLYFSRNFNAEGMGDGFVVAVDPENGKPIWTYRCPKCYVSSPVAYKDSLVITSWVHDKDRTVNGKIQAFDASNGSLQWTMAADGVALLEPAIDAGVLYLARRVGTGVPETHFIKTRSSSGVIAVDLNTRSIKWSLELEAGTFDTPAIADGTLFVGSNLDYLYAIDVLSGAIKWKFKAAARIPVVRDGIVYFGDSFNVYAVNAKTGLLKWKQKNSGGISTPIAVSKSAIFYGGDRIFRCLDRETGDIKWSVKTKGYAYEPVVVGDKIYAGGTRELLMLNAETGERLPTISLGPDDVSTPVFFKDTVIIDNGDGYLFAIKK